MAGLSPVPRVAVALRYSSPTIRVSTSLTLLRRPPARCVRLRGQTSVSRRSPCTERTEKHCGKVGSTYRDVFHHSRGTIFSNMPGSTLFMPVCDVSSTLIGLIAQFVDPRLERFAPKDGRGMNIVDDRYGFRPAGTERWIKNGFLDEHNIMLLSHLERQACYYMFSEPAVICQNMFLATEALGVGGWMHCGFLSRDVFKALEFRTVVPNGQPVLANPIGIDDIFQGYCPPYFPSMDDCGGRAPHATHARKIRAAGMCALFDIRRGASRRHGRHQRRRHRMHQGDL